MTAAAPDSAATDAFRVPPWMHILGGLVSRHPRLWARLGELETRLLADRLDAIEIASPIHVCGLARSGTTVTLELLADRPGVVSHRYRDYPALFTPYAWNRFLDRVPRTAEAAAERAHGDGIEVTPESPEAFEEMLWMAFFPDTHAPGGNPVLGRDCDRPDFARFYHDHIRKLLAVREGTRYLAKGNYSVTRLAYLQRLFPDARFIVNVREPIWHIASLMKQHGLFCAGERAHPRALKHMQRVGHFEFGLDRRPIGIGDAATVRDLWASGHEIEGWARYWDAVHAFIADSLAHDAALREACLVVRFEDLCADATGTLRRIYEHARLEVEPGTIERAAEGLHFPGYYRPPFSDAGFARIAAITAGTARRFGYEPAETADGRTAI